jgi:hypothetical protein
MMNSFNQLPNDKFLSQLLEEDAMAADVKNSPAAADPKKSSVELITDLIKAAAWPLFAVIILIVFLSPFRAVADLLPDIVSRATSIKIGNLAVEIGRNIPPPREEVQKVLATMSPDDIGEILDIVRGGLRVWHGRDINGGKRAAERLLDFDLIEEVSAEDPQRQGQGIPKEAYVVRLTPLGAETKEFLSRIIGEFVEQLKHPQQSSKP